MKEIQTKSGKILCLEVPDDVTWWDIVENDLGGFITKTLDLPQQFLTYGKSSTILGKQVNNRVYYNSDSFYLPKGKWNIIGKLSELIDEDCEEFVELLPSNMYKNYKWPEDKVRLTGIQPINATAKGSFISLLESEGIDTSREYLVIKVL